MISEGLRHRLRNLVPRSLRGQFLLHPLEVDGCARRRRAELAEAP
jgi:hypothetical protein